MLPLLPTLSEQPSGAGQHASLTEASGAALRGSEIRYRRLFEAAQDGILLINAKSGQIEDANPYLTAMLGYSHDELLGKKLWDVGAFVDIEKSTEMFERLQVEGYVRYHDLPLKTKTGALISVEFVSNAYDCAGVRVIQCNIRNFTEQRMAEDQVRKLSLVVEQSPVAIVIANLGDEIEYVNAALLRNSGYSSGELLGRQTRMLQSDASDPDTMADLKATVAQGKTWRTDLLRQNRRSNRCALASIARRAHVFRRDRRGENLCRLFRREVAGVRVGLGGSRDRVLDRHRRQQLRELHNEAFCPHGLAERVVVHTVGVCGSARHAQTPPQLATSRQKRRSAKVRLAPQHVAKRAASSSRPCTPPPAGYPPR